MRLFRSSSCFLLMVSCYTPVLAAPSFQTNLTIPTAAFPDPPQTILVHLYDAETVDLPLTTYVLPTSLWVADNAEVSWKSHAEHRFQATVEFDMLLSVGRNYWAEYEVDGRPVGNRVRVVNPNISIHGIVQSRAGGFQFPDDTVQTTAGVTSETDPTVPASVKDGTDWSELTGIPTDLADGDHDTTYVEGTGLNLSETQFSVAAPYRLPQICNSGQHPSWTGSAWTCGSETDPTVPASVKDGTDWSELTGIPTDLADGHSLNAADDSPVDVVYVDNDGNVGIGATSPGAGLEVDTGPDLDGDGFNKALAVGPLVVESSGVTGVVVIGGNPDSDVQIPAAGTSLLVGGNVGIGTTSPQATLDINGYAKLKKQTAAPVTCDANHDGSLSLTSTYRLCVCDGTGWVYTTDGATSCAWQ